MINHSKSKAALVGLAVGDALGVPVEFTSRTTLQANPVRNMRGYGTHDQPPGTWSDDSSLTFCLAESLAHGYTPTDLANRFVNWLNYNYWTAYGSVFDVGITTRQAILRLEQGVEPTKAGPTGEYDNGNGSIMRILPLAFALEGMMPHERFSRVQEVSNLTHGHIRAVIGCFIYVEYARLLLTGEEKFAAFAELQRTVPDWLRAWQVPADEIALFGRVLQHPLATVPDADIRGSGYVLHSLEAAIWCLLTSDTYAETVLKAVNLGEDTDTTGAVAGGLAGLYYGHDAIPLAWINALARRTEILDLAARMADRLKTDLGQSQD